MTRNQLDLTKLQKFKAHEGQGKEEQGANPKQGQRSTAMDAAKDAVTGAAKDTAGHEMSAGFPSREPVDEAQLNIKLPNAEAARFRHLAKADRYTLGAFLVLLMDRYEGKG